VTRTRSRLAALSTIALLALPALSGCGQNPIHPGAAAVVGDQTLSGSDLNAISRDLCTVLKSDQQSIGSGYPRSALMASVVQAFMLRAVADQLAEEYDVTPDKSYKSSADQIELRFGQADPDALANAMDTFTSTAYFVAVARAAGELELKESGNANPTQDESLTKGIALAQTWQDDHDIDVSPRFPAMKIGDQSIETVRDDTSYAVSDFAKQAAAEQPDKTFVDTLPPSQVCR